MNNKSSVFLLFLIFSILSGFLINLLSDSLYKYSNWLPSIFINTIISVIASVVSIYGYLIIFSSKESIAYNIAIVGFPKSGKTTLIVSMFSEIFYKKQINISAQLSTESTINRVNEALNKLQKGQPIGPTTDQDIFAFRADVKVKKPLYTKKYKVEFGDFPGEDSESYLKNYGPWLHTTPFFKWFVSADAIIFIIDSSLVLSKIYDDNNNFKYDYNNFYIADITTSIRAAWQHLLVNKDGGSKSAHEMPIIIAFTKADLLLKNKSIIDENSVPKFSEFEEEYSNEFEESKLSIVNNFSELINYLSNETKHFNYFFTSSFLEKNGYKLGIIDLLKSVLPKSTNVFLDILKNPLSK